MTSTIRSSLLLCYISFFFICCTTNSLHQIGREEQFMDQGQWANYGNDPGGKRFSPLTIIDTGNVKNLRQIWSYRTGELDTYWNKGIKAIAAFEATPIMIDKTLYFSTPTNRVIALNAATGAEKWVYDPDVNQAAAYSEVTSRGVSKWIDPLLSPDQPGFMRIIVATIDGRLIAVDASNGIPIRSFGRKGEVDLRIGLGKVQVTSPPVITSSLIITGSAMGDNQRIDYPPGVVRAYDVRTGDLRWSWNPIPKDSLDTAYHTWKGTKVKQTGAANAWAPLSVDLERGIVFVPTAAPSPDYYGGERIGKNIYANSLVALDASTGKVKWFFQTVHHDLWDYDNPAQPLLFSLNRSGTKIPAVAIVTKMGHIFVFNRENGKSLFHNEERSVPPTTIPGEENSTTQPFPTQLPLLGLRNVDTTMGWGINDQQRQKAVDRISKYINQGIFTPPSQAGTMIAPSNIGGMHWGGATLDPYNQLLITNTNRIASIIQLSDHQSFDRKKITTNLPRAELGLQRGTPYILIRDYLADFGSNGEVFIQTKPPWGTLAAISLQTGTLVWEVPLGFMLDPGRYPESTKWGALNLGGAIATAGNLVFIGATVDGFFRAFNTLNGDLLWETQLPAGGQATPMTYQVGGSQFVVIAAGGHGKLKTKQGDYLVAYGLDH